MLPSQDSYRRNCLLLRGRGVQWGLWDLSEPPHPGPPPSGPEKGRGGLQKHARVYVASGSLADTVLSRHTPHRQGQPPHREVFLGHPQPESRLSWLHGPALVRGGPRLLICQMGLVRSTRERHEDPAGRQSHPCPLGGLVHPGKLIG